ncbi:MAG: E3 binding domain-containing protein, partial [Chthoniobacterales bacterium]
MRAFSVAKLTLAETPGMRLSTFSTRAAHAAHVIPSIARSTAAAPRARLSPAVRRLAEEHGIDPTRIAGSGENGRVTRDDVLAFHRAYFRPGRAIVTVVGDVEPARVRGAFEKAFAQWASGGERPAFN